MNVDAESLRVLADLLDDLEAPGAEFAHWAPSTTLADGSLTMPYVEPGELEQRFRAAVGRGGWIRPGFDWPAWAGTAEAKAFRDDPERIATATPEELAFLITWIIRGDRFSEGNLLGAFERGHLAAIARRANALLKEVEP